MGDIKSLSAALWAPVRTRVFTSTQLIIVVSVFITLFGNRMFFQALTDAYPFSGTNTIFVASLIIATIAANILVFSLLCFKQGTKPVLITILLISSIAAFFMDSYQVIIDKDMIMNIIHTDAREATDLITPRMLLYLMLLGVLPSIFVYRSRLVNASPKKAIKSRIILIISTLVILLGLLLSLSDFYASFIREHKHIRSYWNPSYYIYSSIKLTRSLLKTQASEFKSIGRDANIPASDEHRELIVLVVGETARSDHFSLNGYQKNTNPLLEKLDVLSFTNVHSCGTSTAYSLPCMFSVYGRDEFSNERGATTENLLDVLQHAGVNIIWLDNNSDSKGVADRVPYQSFRNSDMNPVCDIECRDIGMLTNLQDYIENHPTGDIFIILHQMGNHGPAYYKRYPDEFERFTPTCESNQLEQCSLEEISNTYDNVLVYTDYFLSETIGLLKQYDNQFETALLYVSDHGESLGENNLYLHGLPYMIAPEAQTHVPMIMWFGSSYEIEEINLPKLKASISNQYTHDNLFHTVLGLFEVRTGVYDADLDIIEHYED